MKLQFEQVPSPEPPRFTDRPAPDRRKGPGELAKDDKTADKARAAHAALVVELRSRQIASPPNDFTPENLPPHLAKFLGETPETILLESGPLDGSQIQVRRGAASYARTVANTSGGFVATEYVRVAKRLSNEGFPIFRFRQPAPVAV